MSRKENISSIYEAPSLEEQPVRQFRLAEREGYQPAHNKAQHLLEAAAGGHKPGETSVDTRERGLQRITRTGAAVLTAAAVTVGAGAALESAKHLGDHAAEEQRQSHVEPLQEYQRTGNVPKGDVVVPAGNFDGVAWDWATKYAAPGERQELSGIVNDQADAQGDPGVQSNETFVLPQSELNQATLQHLGKN